MDVAISPFARMRWAASSPVSGRISAITLTAPAEARPSAIAKPIPLLAPVTMAILLERLKRSSNFPFSSPGRTGTLNGHKFHKRIYSQQSLYRKVLEQVRKISCYKLYPFYV
jgi:hypothetical protein